MKLSARVVCVMLLAAAGTVRAAAPADQAQMVRLMEKYGLQLHVIDARSSSTRAVMPLSGAVVYTEQTRLSVGAALVIADDDTQAMKIATTLEQRDPQVPTYAAHGGASAFQSARGTFLATPSDNAQNAHDFVIPKDTCQPGEPVQVYERK